jgi:hypothetical protein
MQTCHTYFHWFFNPECQHIFGKQTGYIFQSPSVIVMTWEKVYTQYVVGNEGDIGRGTRTDVLLPPVPDLLIALAG